MANPYSYGSLGERWTVGWATTKARLDAARIKSDANRWTLISVFDDADEPSDGVRISIKPNANDTLDLGASGAGWRELYLANGATIDWNAGAVTMGAAGTVLTLTDADVLHMTASDATEVRARINNTGAGDAALRLQLGGWTKAVFAVDNDDGDNLKIAAGSAYAAPDIEIDAAGNVVLGTGALATNATDGFVAIPTCAGAATGTPTDFGSFCHLVFDTTNQALYLYDHVTGGWRKIATVAP